MDISDFAPTGEAITDYDRAHGPLYLRLLDAEAAGAPWEEAARRLLGVDPDRDRDRARLRYDTHLSRARWLREAGYRKLAQPPS